MGICMFLKKKLIDTVIIHILGCSVALQYFYMMYNNQIKVADTFITSNIYHFFVLRAFKILSTSHLKYMNNGKSWLHCCAMKH